MKLSELIEKLEKWMRLGKATKGKIGVYDVCIGGLDKEDSIVISKKMGDDNIFTEAYLDGVSPIRMSVYSEKIALAKLGFVDDLYRAPTPTFSEIIDTARKLEKLGRVLAEFGEYRVFRDKRECISYDIFRLGDGKTLIKIPKGEDFYDFMENVKNRKSELEALGFIDDLEAPKEGVKVGEVHTLGLRTDGKSTKVDDITIDNPTPQELMQKAHEVVEEAKKHDVVNHPSHYTQGKVECIDALESATINKRGIEAVCTANIIKYLWRYESKNGIEDVKKAQWYLQKLISELEKQQKE